MGVLVYAANSIEENPAPVVGVLGLVLGAVLGIWYDKKHKKCDCDDVDAYSEMGNRSETL